MLKTFRVISEVAVNGIAKGEEFEAEWPSDWLRRRIDSSHIEEVSDEETTEDLKEVLEEPDLDDPDEEEPDEDLEEEVKLWRL